jgi:hypothetical protein
MGFWESLKFSKYSNEAEFKRQVAEISVIMLGFGSNEHQCFWKIKQNKLIQVVRLLSSFVLHWDEKFSCIALIMLQI